MRREEYMMLLSVSAWPPVISQKRTQVAVSIFFALHDAGRVVTALLFLRSGLWEHQAAHDSFSQSSIDICPSSSSCSLSLMSIILSASASSFLAAAWTLRASPISIGAGVTV